MGKGGKRWEYPGRKTIFSPMASPTRGECGTKIAYGPSAGTAVTLWLNQVVCFGATEEGGEDHMRFRGFGGFQEDTILMGSNDRPIVPSRINPRFFSILSVPSSVPERPGWVAGHELMAL
jgi:hypothetical protein